MVGPVYPYRGGIAHYTSSLAKAFVRSGHQLQMISYQRQYPAALYPGETDKDPSVDPARVEAQYLLDPLYPWTWRRTARAILESRPDLALIQWWTTFWAPAYAVLAHELRQSTRVVYLIHNVLPHESRPWDRWAARLALAQGQAFIVQAPHEQKRLSQLIPNAAISYCSLPAYEHFSAQIVSKETARRQLGLPAGVPLFLFFGIVRPYKGLKYLIEALAQISVPFHLLVAGEFWESILKYEKRVEQLHLSAHVTFINKYIPNEEAHLMFAAADALVAPYVEGTQSAAVGASLGYGLPTIVTQKIAAGIPTDTHGLQILPAGDAAALAHAMTRVARSLPLPAANQSPRDAWRGLVKVVEELHESSLRNSND
ncbi:MAG TPA: glycosyltransferase [Candidatus Binatia bacterium]|nr:glycosyltransferase [Candidatus Binatia bacterium]